MENRLLFKYNGREQKLVHIYINSSSLKAVYSNTSSFKIVYISSREQQTMDDVVTIDIVLYYLKNVSQWTKNTSVLEPKELC